MRVAVFVLILGVLLSASDLAVNAVSAQPSQGLIGWWKFDDGSGGIAADSSGSGLNAAVDGSEWIPGKVGGALDFGNNSLDAVSIPFSPAMNSGQMSLTFWIMLKSRDRPGRVMTRYVNEWNKAFWILFDYTGNTLASSMTTTAGSSYIKSSRPLALNYWHHAAIVYDGVNHRIYLDGSPVAEGPLNGSITSTGNLVFGASMNYYVSSDMALDDVRLFDRPLTQQEIADILLEGGGTPVPTISSFSSAPATVDYGGSAALSWNVANAFSLNIDNGVGDVTGLSSRTVSPSQTTTYTLTATNPAGSSAKSVTVNVNPPPIPPVISSFTASPSYISPGQSASLAWSVSGAAALSIDQGVGAVTGLSSMQVSPGSSTVYTLTASNAYGTTERSTTLAVVPAGAGDYMPGGLVSYPSRELGPNLLRNSGFEQLGANGKPANWTLLPAYDSDDMVAHSGSRSLRLKDAPGGGVTDYGEQSVFLRKGSYRLSGWIRAQDIGAINRYGGVRMSVSSQEGWETGGGSSEILSGTFDWRHVEIKNIAFTRDTTAGVYVDAYSDVDGTAWFDDLELREELANPVEAYMLYPNYRGYLFSDQSQVMRFDVAVSPPSGNFGDYQVRAVIIRESDNATISQQNFPASASFVAQLDGSSLARDEPCLAKFRLIRTSDGLQVYEYPAYRVIRKDGSERAAMTLSFNEQNQILVNGKPTFLLGVYDSGGGYYNTEAYYENRLIEQRRLFELPINLYMDYWLGGAPTYSINLLMNVLRRHGILGFTNANCFDTWSIEAAASNGYWFTNSDDGDVMSRAFHPAFAGFYGMDECIPEFAEGGFSHYYRMKALDPDGVIWGAGNKPTTLFYWRDILDLPSMDPYAMYGREPASGYDYSMVANWTRNTKTAFMNSRPVATVIQFFDFGGAWPTREQMRKMSYMAIAEGADGLIYWSLGVNALAYVCTGWCDEKTAYFDDLKAVMTEIKNLDAALTSVDRPDLLAGISSPSIHTRVKFADGNGCVIASNNVNANVTATFTWASSPDAVYVYGEGRNLGVQGSGFTDEFTPYQSHVYMISASNSAPVISAGSPSGTIPANSAQAILYVSTDKASSCRYSANPGVSFGSMQNSFQSSDGRAHTALVSGLANDAIYKYYVRCSSAGAANSGDYMVIFKVDVPAPVISGVAASFSSAGVTIAWNTNEPADGQAEFGQTTSYGNESQLNDAMETSHRTTLPYVPAGSSIHFRVKSRNARGKLSVSSDHETTVAVAPYSPIRINAGSPGSVTDSKGGFWSGDSGYVGGWREHGYYYVSNTEDDALYQIWRASNAPFSYVFAIPDGSYTLRLKFSEQDPNARPGDRLFNVTANGQTILGNFDVLDQAGSVQTALDRTFGINVSGGRLTLGFVPVKGNAKINAIEITSNAVRYPLRFKLSSLEGAAAIGSDPAILAQVISPETRNVLASGTLSANAGHEYAVNFSTNYPAQISVRLIVQGYLPMTLQAVDTTVDNPVMNVSQLLAGDLNSDGIVNALDFSVMSRRWNSNFQLADYNRDGTIGQADLSLLRKNWHVREG